MLWTHLQLQRQGEPLCSSMEAPGTLAETVESCYLVLEAEACPGHQRAPTQKDVVTTSTQFIRIQSIDLNRCAVRHLIRVKPLYGYAKITCTASLCLWDSVLLSVLLLPVYT